MTKHTVRIVVMRCPYKRVSLKQDLTAQSNPLNTDTEGAIESVCIKGVFVLNRLRGRRKKGRGRGEGEKRERGEMLRERLLKCIRAGVFVFRPPFSLLLAVYDKQ